MFIACWECRKSCTWGRGTVELGELEPTIDRRRGGQLGELGQLSSSCSFRLSSLRDGPRLPARGGLAMLGSQRSAYGSSTWAAAMMKCLTQEHSPSTSSPILHRCKNRAATRIQLWGRLQKLDRTLGAVSIQPDVSFCRHNGSESAPGCCRSFVAVCLHRGTDFPTSGRMPDIRMCVPSGSV